MYRGLKTNRSRVWTIREILAVVKGNYSGKDPLTRRASPHSEFDFAIRAKLQREPHHASSPSGRAIVLASPEDAFRLILGIWAPLRPSLARLDPKSVDSVTTQRFKNEQKDSLKVRSVRSVNRLDMHDMRPKQ
jgi:hypothetical protein